MPNDKEDLIGTGFSYNRIMKGKAPKLPECESKAAYCLGKRCPRFCIMGGSCKPEACIQKGR